MGEPTALYIIPAILISSLLVFVVLCVMRVRRLRAAELDDENDTAQPPSTTLRQRRVIRHTASGGRWPRRGRSASDVESARAAIRLTPIRTNLGGHHSILQPTYIATTRGTPREGLAEASVSHTRPSPVVSATLPPLPHTPPPPYNEALQGDGSVAVRQTWL
jgi:hypothetical protein